MAGQSYKYWKKLFFCVTMEKTIRKETLITMAFYEDYLALPKRLTFEEMVSLHREIMTEAGCDGDALSLYSDLLAAAVKYAESRSHWPLWDREKKQEEDPVCTFRHNQVIDSLNILARYLRKQGKSATWRNVFDDDRKRIGDFACYLVFVESLNAR